MDSYEILRVPRQDNTPTSSLIQTITERRWQWRLDWLVCHHSRGATGLCAITPTFQYPSWTGYALRRPWSMHRGKHSKKTDKQSPHRRWYCVNGRKCKWPPVLVDRVQDSSCNVSLKINIAKTEVQAISKQKINLCININGTQLKQVEEFIYLGGTISEGGSCTKDIQHRIGKALEAVQALHNIWWSKEITNSTKVELYYKVLILTILLHVAETWTLKKVDANRLQTFEMMCLRKILGVTRMDEIRNTSIRQTLGIKNTIPFF